ncbi:MAG TPA: elongation factor Ts [Deltaproteobacteria bacterium]|nr:MAG: translation elongation factor Ts [Deltaproteobacteria bacterium GWA2_45_12]HBF11790.1 elongation factor Ts [Deltaproteobacteria bacterium]
MEISAQLVKDLREQTGAGMMECKKTLTEVKGDIQAAVEYLRKQGLNALAKKAARIAADGRVAIEISADGRVASLVEVNSETDFVAKSEDFKNFVQRLAHLVASLNPSNIEALSSAKYGEEGLVADRLSQLVAKIGEKMSLRRFVRLESKAGEKLGGYIHLGDKIGVLVHFQGDAPEAVTKDVAMHIAAMNPRYLQTNQIPAEVLEKEKAIFLEQMKDSGKPKEILEKIIKGKIAKFSSEVCLVDQVFIKDPTGKKSVAQVLKEINSSLKVVAFQRFQVGEGIERKADDFAAEVAKMAK